MSEWNGKLICEMETSHIENTMAYLLKSAAKQARKLGSGDAKLYLDNSYFDLKQELEKREIII